MAEEIGYEHEGVKLKMRTDNVRQHLLLTIGKGETIKLTRPAAKFLSAVFHVYADTLSIDSIPTKEEGDD